MDHQHPLSCSIAIDAPLARVWELVSDVRRMADWSPQVERVRLEEGHDEPGLGTRFVNDNVHGSLAWPTHGQIVRWDPLREMAFRIAENWVVWSFELTVGDHETTLTQTRETPDGLSPESRRLIERYMGGAATFTQTMRDGMAETLARLKAQAEASYDAPLAPR